MKRSLRERIGAKLSQGRMVWLVIVFGIVLSLPSLSGGMIADDHHFRMIARGAPGVPEMSQSPLDAFNFTGMEASDKAQRKARGLTVWWTPEDMQIAFWRPISALTHWLDNAAWGNQAWLMHLQNVVWYGVLLGAVVLLYRRIGMAAWVAALAALLYAIDDAHAIPVAWIAGRNALLSGLFGVLTLIAHDAWRRQGLKMAGAGAPVVFALGLLCGESAAGTGGFLLAYAVFMDPGKRWRRMASLLPYIGVGVLWRLVYRQMGYGVAASSLYMEPLAQPLAYAKNVVTNIPLMLAGQFAFPDPTIWLVSDTAERGALLLWAGVIVAVALWLLWPGLKREREIRFWLAGTLVAMAPSCATWPQNRLMILPGVGALALLAHAIVLGIQGGPDGGARRRIALALFVMNALLAPIVFLGTTAAIGLPARYMARLDASVPGTDAAEEKDIIVVSAPVDVFAVSIPISRSSQARPVPKSVLLLRSGLGSADIFRVDDRTLIVTTPEGLVERPWSMLFRNVETHPFGVGERVRLPNAEITVLSVSPRGNPIEVAFRFDKPLEEAGDWRIWDGAAFAEFPLPLVGESRYVRRGHLTDLMLAGLRGSLGFSE